MARTVAVTDATFKAEVYEAVKPVLVYFWAPWSEPCKAMIPMLGDVAAHQNARLRVASVDIDTNAASSASFGIQDVPTLILFKNGRPITRLVGVLTKDELLEKVSPLLF